MLKKFLLLPICLVTTQMSLLAQQPDGVLPLWPEGKVPEARGNDPVKDIPTLTPFWPAPEKATGAAMIICPGGGYGKLADHEGKDYGMWLARHGIAGLVLKYRLGTNGYRHPAMMHDIQRAIRFVRFHAAEWKINPAQIGVMGSSAGGHVASTALTHFDVGNVDAEDPVDRISCRPDLGVLCYPVITMGPLTHPGSKKNLLGESPSPELVTLLSNELQVTPETPPCFLWSTCDDAAVPVANTLDFAEALRRNNVPFELHIYQTGRHGLGLGNRDLKIGVDDDSKLLPWTSELKTWLKLQQFIKTPQTQ